MEGKRWAKTFSNPNKIWDRSRGRKLKEWLNLQQNKSINVVPKTKISDRKENQMQESYTLNVQR